MAETPADVTLIPPPARETAKARFRVLVAAEAERIGRQVDEACEQARADVEQRIQLIRERGAAEVAELQRLADAAEAAADGVAGRDPYGRTPDWAEAGLLDKKVPHFMSIREDGSDPDDEGQEVPRDE